MEYNPPAWSDIRDMCEKWCPDDCDQGCPFYQPDGVLYDCGCFFNLHPCDWDIKELSRLFRGK